MGKVALFSGIVVLLWLLTACQGTTSGGSGALATPPPPSTSTPSASQTMTPVVTPSVTPAVTPAATAATTPPATPAVKGPGGNMAATADDQVALAKKDLANRLGITTESITVSNVEEVQWPDTSLGCPEPGKMYAQMVTPGYRIVLQAGGKDYEYHTDKGKNVVLCSRLG